ncbi:hypothetical protein P8C59_008599 [Phyllachora maydis]|uniref:Uncharacterized protein n=1 Tax=Phyllachora maydis TaxID=1825666 RepID=A0AAD9IAS3_9PEZI|nr:hypothetical protein P8C59_008599 [Phyllachora maydis]
MALLIAAIATNFTRVSNINKKDNKSKTLTLRFIMDLSKLSLDDKLAIATTGVTTSSIGVNLLITTTTTTTTTIITATTTTTTTITAATTITTTTTTVITTATTAIIEYRKEEKR